jgi:hypothetical protein
MKIKIMYFKTFAAASVMLVATACDSFLDINQNPNNPSRASISLLLPQAEVSAGFWTSRTQNENAAIFVRQFYNLNESTYNIQGNLTDTEFNSFYSDPLKDFQEVIHQAEEKDLKGYAGISKVMKAYLASVLVDLWGEVPFSEALEGESNVAPAFENGNVVYDKLLLLLDEAKVDLTEATTRGELAVGDIIYNGNFEQWIRVCNTLKLKLFLNLRLRDEDRARTEISTLITENKLIDNNADNFLFQFGTSQAPINQHPVYQQEYTAGNKIFYMSNYLMYNMISKNDPRLKYYVYRQGSNSELDFQLSPCSSRTDCIYWPLLVAMPDNNNDGIPDASDGYIGREHGDPSGIPGDNALRATFGVYPIGGSYDDNSRAERKITSSTGAGIAPWITSSMRAFMLAEAAITLGTAGDVEQLLEEGVRSSMELVTRFGATVDSKAPPANTPALLTSINTYVANILDRYADAANPSQQLDVLIKEKYYAQFGNGVEVYNDFRRTGFPSDLPASLAPGGPFPLRFPLGPTELTSNPNAPKPAPLVSEPIFWDVN